MGDRVTLYIRAEGAPSEEEDGHVPGAYMVEVDADLDPADRASAALDIFHGRVAVGCLDDFTFTVIDADGNELDENPEHDGHSLEGRGVFYGPIRDDEIPRPPTSAGPAAP